MRILLKIAVALCLLVVVICLLVAVGISQNFGPTHNNTCIRLDGTLGDCVALQECEPVIKLLESSTNKTAPNNVYDDIRNHHCDASIRSASVCCPRKQKPKTFEELLPLKTCGKVDYDNKVSFGNTTDLFQYPWMAQLAYKTENGIEYLCGGTLITERYILTAGHCVPRYGYRKLVYVRLGEHNMSSPIDCQQDGTCAAEPQDIEIEAKIFHPEFDRVELLNDIALLRLKQRANTSVDSVKPICLPVLPNVPRASLTKVIVTGWGLTEKNERSDVLLQGSAGIMDHASCQKLYKNTNVTEAQICVGGDKVGSCQGDSGGPIQALQAFNDDVRYVQYGIVSQGPSTCGADGLPGIHTRVEFYLDFIISNIKP